MKTLHDVVTFKFTPHVKPESYHIPDHTLHTSTVRNIIEPEAVIMPDEITALFGVEKGLRSIHRYPVQGQAGTPHRLSEYWFPDELARPCLQRLKDEPGHDILEDINIEKYTCTRSKENEWNPRWTGTDASLNCVCRNTDHIGVRL